MATFLRIHGDNIIECERGLDLLCQAFDAEPKRASKNIFVPSYQIVKGEFVLFDVDLLSGHDRWGVKLTEQLASHGAPLRESTDVYFTKVSADQTTEEVLLACEFCSALPAGNNAWQRSGRAATCLEIGIPYLYFAEIGGVELDSERGVIAERFPNPIVPFSYVSASQTLEIICLPVYQAHPAIEESSRSHYQPVFGYAESLEIIRGVIDGSDVTAAYRSLLSKGVELVRLLSSRRSRVDTLRDAQWDSYLGVTNGKDKAEWLSLPRNKQVWKRGLGTTVPTTKTYRAFVEQLPYASPISVGATGLPMCVIPVEGITAFKKVLSNVYSAVSSIQDLVAAISDSEPLLLVWITGFKPKGDDSRPDRGLVPLARMLFGNDINLMAIVHGPAKSASWKVVRTTPNIARTNGLWEAILNLSNYVLADSTTAADGPFGLLNEARIVQEQSTVTFSYSTPTVEYSEHDVDTAIHTIFSRQHSLNVFESLCNPPGGDWSGVSVLDSSTGDEYRWTSLPRVSSNSGKRPDHIIQLTLEKETIFLSIESKGLANKLEPNIGKDLISFVSTLFSTLPTAYRPHGNHSSAFTGSSVPLKNYRIISGGAFCYRSLTELDNAIKDKSLHFAMAFEFKAMGEKSILHFKALEGYDFLADLLSKIISDFKGWFEIKIH